MFVVLAYSQKFSKCFGPFPEMDKVVAWLNLQPDIQVKHEIFGLIPPDYPDPKPLPLSSENKEEMIVFIGKNKYLTHCYGPFKGYSSLIQWLNAHYATNAEHYQGERLYRCLELINPYEKNHV
ncbi:hypothetical protein [Laspinema palackyanum]|uniref:hypothetical protein n=1 Tax=Laspinema palackyanum TaxID=3231601 RepID=UPI00345D2888|nr:hypothetical protein [Laspinema sp. D2c]